AAKDAAVARAVSGGDDELRIGRGMPGAPQRLGHVARHRPRYHKAVGVARGGHEMHTESLEVVVRAGQAPNLQLTAIARARVDLADGKRAAEVRANLLGQSRPESLHL